MTEDRTPIEAAYRAGPDAGGPVLVVAHGFSGSLRRPALVHAAEVFGRYAGVVTFSFRGHGRSGGRSTVGDREVQDLAAAVRWARALGHERVATVGFSMGGSVVLRHAALHRAPEGGSSEGGGGSERERAGRTGAHADAVVSVSAPARWYYRGTAPMRRLHWAVERPLGRAVSRAALRTRIHHERWDPVPLSPVAAAPLIAPTPLLIVHGDRDAYFPLDHPRSLAAAAPHAELWLEEGFGHAENAAPDELLERVARWAVHEAG
ncbi:alpha/beta hydrolase [Streptomyces smaragdinus]|nr:alpha/beta fold hydrolase [Streptomyces smaragdinus]